MAVSLGGVVLNDNMVWTERFSSSLVAQTVKTTLGGVPIVFAAPLTKGQSVTLIATQDYGWLDLTTVQQLQALADSPGAIYSLVFGSETLSVVFRHNESPALDMVPFVPRVAHEAGDQFIGQIKLLTV